MAAYKAAIDDGADGFECDVRITKDNQLLLWHDPDMKRVAGSTTRIADSTLSEIKDYYPEVMRRFTSAASIGPGIATLRKEAHLLEDPRNLFVWTVDDADDMRFCANNGVDVLITNNPSNARSVLGYH